MGITDWLSIIALIIAIVSFAFSWKWADESSRNLEEIRKVAEKIEGKVERTISEIERKVDERTKDIERIVDERTKAIEQKVEERLTDLINRAAPSEADKAFVNVLNQVGPDLFRSIMTNPELLKFFLEQQKKE